MEVAAPLSQLEREHEREHDELDVKIKFNHNEYNYPNEDRRVALPGAKPRPKEMWTEITKDLVSREAIEIVGYPYEETEDFFYVMEYLKYVS